MQLDRQRGQTIVEMIVALPIVLLALFGVLYVARVGVINERAELALRYGGITSFDANSGAYSIENMYQNVSNVYTTPGPCPTPPAGVFSGASPFPGPTSAPFWQPDDANGPTTTCTPSVLGFGGAQFLATHYVMATVVNVTAHVNVPAYLSGLIGSASTLSTTAQFEHGAPPAMILYCSKEVENRVWGAITAESSTNTPPPPPPNNGACH